MSNFRVDKIQGIDTTYTTFATGVTVPLNKSVTISGSGSLSTVGIVTGKLIGDGSALINLPISREGKIAGISIMGIL